MNEWLSWWWWFSHEIMFDSFVTPWTIPHQAPRSMGFSRQEYWSGLPFASPGDLARDRTHISCIAGGFFTNRATWEVQTSCLLLTNAYTLLKSLQFYMLNTQEFVKNLVLRRWSGLRAGV